MVDSTLGTHTIDQALLLFGRPKSVTGFFRTLRGVDSEIDDTFTIILQYDGAQKNLLVTIKTTIITPMQDQLKYFFRGTKGSFVKASLVHCAVIRILTPLQHGEDPQAEQTMGSGMSATDPRYGFEDERTYGLLATTDEFDGKVQKYDERSKLYVGRYPSMQGHYLGYYENLVDTIHGQKSIAVNSEDSRDGLRVIELARESHEKGVAVQWS